MEKRKDETAVSCIVIRDYIDESRIEEIEDELKELEYHGATYSFSKGNILEFNVPISNKPLRQQQRSLRSDNRFTDLIKKYGTEASKRNK